jgi:hypothetical protein
LITTGQFNDAKQFKKELPIVWTGRPAPGARARAGRLFDAVIRRDQILPGGQDVSRTRFGKIDEARSAGLASADELPAFTRAGYCAAGQGKDRSVCERSLHEMGKVVALKSFPSRRTNPNAGMFEWKAPPGVMGNLRLNLFSDNTFFAHIRLTLQGL